MIEDGENVERNSSEEIESQDIYMLNTSTYYWNFTYLLIWLFIEYVNLLCTINSNMYKWNEYRWWDVEKCWHSHIWR